MTTVAQITGDLRVTGNLRVGGSIPKVSRTDLEQNADQVYSVDLTSVRVWDAIHTVLPGTPANDDLGIDGGTFGTDSIKLTTGDLKAAGATTRYGRFTTTLPPEYDNGQTVTIRMSAGMETAVSDGTATLDVECYKSDGETGVGSDLCTTAATSINSLTFANKDFTITPTGLSSGDVLDIRVAIAINDTATGTAVIGTIGAIERLLDIRG